MKEISTWTRVPEVASGGVAYSLSWRSCSPGQGEFHKVQRKAFSAALTRAQAKMSQQKEDPLTTQKSPCQEAKSTLPRRRPTGWVKHLMGITRFSSLSKLKRVIAWIHKAAEQWLKKNSNPKQPKGEATTPKQAGLTSEELEDARDNRFPKAQVGVTFPGTTLSRVNK